MPELFSVPEARRSAKPGVTLASLVVSSSGAAPILPRRGLGDSSLTNILPPFGTNPPTGPIVPADYDYSQRTIQNDPRELWYLALPDKLTPKQCAQIVRSSLGGDLWQLWQLESLMLMSWPMLRKCSHEVRSQIANVKYKAIPYALPGQEPTDSAKAKADLVTRAMRSMNPNQFREEEGFSGMVYDATDAMLAGVSMLELLWEQTGSEWLPRASAWVHPRHFTFTNDGAVAVFNKDYARLMWNAQKGTEPDPLKFMMCKFKSRTGSSLGGGFVNVLAWYWSSVVLCKEWNLISAQRHGSPFIDMTYKPGMPDAEIAKLKEFAASAAANGWIVHIEGSTVEVHPAQNLGPDNPQRTRVQEANEACQLIWLGQTGTTTPTPGKLGEDTSHQDKERGIIQVAAKWIAASVLTDQFSRAVLTMNYGNARECPEVIADFTEEEAPADAATRMSSIVGMGVPLLADDVYRTLHMTEPEQGDKVFSGGRIGIQASTEDEVGGKPELPQNPVPPGVRADGRQTNADGPEDVLRKQLAAASSEQLTDLREALVKASQAKDVNGEWEDVQAKVSKLSERRF